MRLGIGTVQFGLDYGISNTTGRVSLEEVGRILDRAADLGIRDIDTAASYGDSETALGTFLGTKPEFRIVTKTAVMDSQPIDADGARRVVDTVYRSLERLRQPSVYALLVHHAEDLLGEGAELLWRALEGLRETGVCTRLGVSLYHIREIEEILSRFPVDIVQIAVNVFDQRWLKSGWLKRLRDRNVEIHVRSIFLQGLLLMDHQSLPPHFAPWREQFHAYAGFRTERRWSPLEAAVRFIRTVGEIDCVVTGVHSAQHIDEIHAAWSAARDGDRGDFEPFAVSDENLLNPSCWALAPAR